MANGTDASTLYDTPQTVIKDEGIDPRAVHLEGIRARQAAKAKQRAENQKKLDQAHQALTDLEASGWYKHDRTRTERRDSLRNYLTNVYSEHGLEAFSGQEGRARMDQFNNMISDYEKFENYSGQLQTEYESMAKEAVKNPGEYTQESLDNFWNWKDLTFEEQMEAGLPLLEEIVPRENYFEDIQGITIPYVEYSTEDIGTGDMEGWIKSSSGVYANKEKLNSIAENYVKTGMTGSNKFGATLYEDIVSELERSPDGRTYSSAEEDIDEETGMTPFEMEAYNRSVDKVYEMLLDRAKQEHKSGVQQMTGTKDDESPLSDYYSGEVQGVHGLASTRNERVISQTGGGTKEAKSFQINTPKYVNEDGDLVEGNREGFFFYPHKEYTVTVAKKDFRDRSTGKTIKKGQIVPDDVQADPKNTKEETYVEGIRNETEMVGTGLTNMFQNKITNQKTIRIPKKYVKKDLERHVVGYKEGEEVKTKEEEEFDKLYESDYSVEDAESDI